MEFYVGLGHTVQNTDDVFWRLSTTNQDLFDGLLEGGLIALSKHPDAQAYWFVMDHFTKYRVRDLINQKLDFWWIIPRADANVAYLTANTQTSWIVVLSHPTQDMYFIGEFEEFTYLQGVLSMIQAFNLNYTDVIMYAPLHRTGVSYAMSGYDLPVLNDV